MANKEAAARKRALFEDIYALDNDPSDEYEEDEGLTLSRDTIDVQQPISPKVRRTPGLVRSASSPFPTQYSNRSSKPKRASALEMLEDAEAVKDTPVRRLGKSATITGVDSLRQTSRDSQMSPLATVSGAGVKRKRDPKAPTLKKSATSAIPPLSNISTTKPLPSPPLATTSSAEVKRKRDSEAPTLKRSATSAIPSTSNISTTKPVPSLRKSATVTGVETNKDLIMPTSSAIPRLPGKKKGDAKINLVPEDQRVFSGLHFFFFPNDDINPGRRMRIAKALEYGATWQKEWNAAVTHIITDFGMNWGQITTYLSKNKGPTADDFPSHVAVVDQSYPSDCIKFRMLLDPRQRNYLIQGYTLPKPPADRATEETAAIVTPAVPSQVSDKSLQIKLPGKSVMARQQQTMSTAGESSSIPSATAQSNESVDENHVDPEIGGDELDAAIREAKKTEHLTFESDNEDSEEPVPGNLQLTAQRGRVRTQKDTPAWQDKFQCMHKHDGASTGGPNSYAITLLQEMADYYVQTRDDWRQRAYRSAIAALRNHPHPITTKAEAEKLNGVGTSIAEKIEEIFVSHKLRKLDNAKLDPRQRILQTFIKIYGAGYTVADKWVNMGYRTLDDLNKKADLTPNQRIGLDHYDDFNARIPRSEVEEHANIVRKTLKQIDSRYQVYTMGSYRRGAESSGDIDCMITKPGAPMKEIRETTIKKLVPLLTERGFLVAALATTSEEDGSKLHGASCLPNAHIWRRMDLLLVPDEELGAALIYFTGNDIFNRSLRLLASKKGMRLNQRGLYKDVLRGAGREKLSEGELVEGRDERKIFEALGVPWRPPQHRIC